MNRFERSNGFDTALYINIPFFIKLFMAGNVCVDASVYWGNE